MINLYLLRHASAGNKRTNPLLDVKRPLDRDGKHHALRLAYLLNALKIQFDLIASSPLKRALQTASMIGTEMGYEKQILLSNSLAPAATFADFQKLLHEMAEHENVLVVGHNPNLAGFLGQMLTPQRARTSANIRLRKGSIARVTLDRGDAQLQSMLDPRLIRAIYTTATKPRRKRTPRK